MASCVDAVFGQTDRAPLQLLQRLIFRSISGWRTHLYRQAITPSRWMWLQQWWNKKASIGQHAFLIPTGHSVTSKDYSLLFIVHDREHYLRAIWCLDGIQVLSSQFYISPATDDTERYVPLSVQTNATKVAQGQE